MQKRLCILMVAFGLVAAQEAFCAPGSTANAGDDPISLRLKTGMITEAEFPQAIANVVKSVPSTSLEIDTLGNRMFLLPMGNLDTDIHVVTQNDVSYIFHLITDEARNAGLIKIKKTSAVNNDPKSKEIVNTIELMKALMRGEQPSGSVSSKLQAQEIFNNGTFRIVADEAYELQGNAKAFVLTFENLRNKPVVVPIEHIEFPGLLAISVDSQILEARPRDTAKNPSGFSTRAYMIVEGANS